MTYIADVTGELPLLGLQLLVVSPTSKLTLSVNTGKLIFFGAKRSQKIILSSKQFARRTPISSRSTGYSIPSFDWSCVRFCPYVRCDSMIVERVLFFEISLSETRSRYLFDWLRLAFARHSLVFQRVSQWDLSQPESQWKRERMTYKWCWATCF